MFNFKWGGVCVCVRIRQQEKYNTAVLERRASQRIKYFLILIRKTAMKGLGVAGDSNINEIKQYTELGGSSRIARNS